MMSNAAVFTAIQRTIEQYKSKLSELKPTQFQTTPATGGWSYSEVYLHIFDASLLSLQPLQECLSGTGKIRPTAFIVKVILFLGFLPPAIRYKMPAQLAPRVKKVDKETAAQYILRFEQALKSVYPEIANASDSIKAKHPRMGYLNASQWLRFIEIHLKHHLKQLKRIEKSF